MGRRDRLFRKAVCGIMLFLLLIGVFSLAVNIKPVKSIWTGTVYIRADGSIDPPDAPIITYDNITYTLTDNITSSGDGIVVERDNIIIDGAGYTIQGTESGRGIDLSYRTNVTARNTQIQNFYYGVCLRYSSKNSISGNKITENKWYGVYFDNSSNNIITGNNIANNRFGIWLVYSSNNIISENNVTNYWFGFEFEYSSNNIITGNNIANNCDGVWLVYSSNNWFYHNNIINNTRQVLSYQSSTNVWDDGYPSGGNYWSDYKGVDHYSGPYQNETGSDAIGDTSYVIDENNIDHYPLMNPWGSGTPIASFSWSPSTPEVGEVVTFDASASMPVGGEIVSYEWNFGDGKRATGMIVTHVYGSARTFTVTLNVTDSEGLWDIEQKQIEVKAPPPPLTVSISPLSASILVGQSVTFTSTVTGGYTPYSYQWYLNGNPVSGATSPSWTFTPTTSGIYYINLKVTDGKGNTAQSETARIAVASVPVGGYSIPIQVHIKTELITLYIALLTILTTTYTTIKRKTKRKQYPIN